MANIDTISDSLTIIRNACAVKHQKAKIKHSKIMENIVNILKQEGYIEDFSVENKKNIIINLKYDLKKNSVITEISRISKSSRREYSSVKKIPRIANGYATVILTTPKGILTGREARKQNVGGEVLCFVL
ncbi:MAG: 30S ribosomal protein S8 [Spirochaetes bacterium GWF1_41_5]|nr:MAG: 30S ribosomal protein S8 [Spirochaetes bacterium GWF1_41_5]HBE03494.1 30S ribosomal protein S8 [Spirochaetia bacterium]